MISSKVSHVFIDHGFDDDVFRKQFISQMFTSQSLKDLLPSAKGQKETLVEAVLEALSNGQLTTDDILLNHVKNSRMWLSFKVGEYIQLPDNLLPASKLIDNFGKEGWYGPINDPQSDKVWLIRTVHVEDKYYMGSDQTRQASMRKFRWTVFAELSPTYIALYWSGFTFSRNVDKNASQFPFWNHIPDFFDELRTQCKSTWSEPNFYDLVMNKLWRKYKENSINKYSWRDLKIRAESSGVALNASSSGIAEVDINGLKVLSQRIAEACIKAMEVEPGVHKSKVEDAVTKTLIQEWGAKSYEFIIEEKSEEEKNNKKLFRSHCYFGRNHESKGEDCFPHFKCYSEYGNSVGALKFLLEEINL